MSAEVGDIAQHMSTKRKDVDMSSVISIHDWYLKTYASDITDGSSLKSSLMTNYAYRGLTHPCVKTDEGYLPDFKHRYMTEDIPFGLAVLRGIGEAAGVATPHIDAVLTWAQEKMGKSYLVDGKLTGKDLKESRAPQAYGFTTLEEMISAVH